MLLFLISQRKKLSPQHPTSPTKLCCDTSTSKNSSDCFEKQASLGENVDGKILQILDDLLNLFEGTAKVLWNRLMSLFNISTLYVKVD